MIDYIDSVILRRMFLAGVSNLESKKEWINELNVFPVPDGDTGTNMTLTMLSAVKEINQLQTNASMSDLCSKISMGTLRGARGNSGVITSQLCRGFVKVASGKDKLDKKALAEAMDHAVATAYKAVMKPKEGTILTVAKAAATKATELAGENISLGEFFNEILKYSEQILLKTPEMLPVLKEAGVVDSGGQGLVEIFKGAIDGFYGKETSYDISASRGESVRTYSGERVVDSSNIATSDIKYGYCTEFIVMADKEPSENDIDNIKSFLSSIGDSLVCVAMDNIIKIHVHTNHPGQAFEKGLEYGQLTSMKVDNMREEHNEKVIKEADRAQAAIQENKREALKKKKKKNGFVAICAGDGLVKIYSELGVDKIVEGGQTMNPSTEDILSAIDEVNAETVFVFPNNGNIIMAAKQAKNLCNDKNIVIIPTKSITQGITALINYDDAASDTENEKLMTEALARVKSAEITYAVRDTELYGKNINKGDYMGIGEGKLLSAGKDLKKAAEETITELVDADSEIVTIYYGKDVTEADAEAVAKAVEGKCNDAEVELVYGGQPIYYYFISVE